MRVYVSFGRGLYSFRARNNDDFTVGLLQQIVQDDSNDLEGVIADPMWSNNLIAGKKFGFVKDYHGDDLSKYKSDELLTDEFRLTEGCRVYIVKSD